ncbi:MULTISPECIES: hypothetical protein [Vibrio]|uniref:Uncharacterized protein n=4 Tax=Vibrio TaxID=662 RepID=A0AAN0W055_9VIBR|nr:MULTISPECIES: hypothetical protein [Vibrio]CAH1588591.1 conserved hypothetical protein [Vibrio jasicida]AIW22355.1 hypothetical protein IX92_25120 [Vibrio coralliilyticus]KIF53285.1 hypothetical protein H735_10200 [Vibrio owensii CAIM 1854 = LMG 25443]NOH36909.1 hypothetical protein [Vibrio coralliilyticus]PAW02425.1 hypothetical protein CKJ79_17325 [Vibrio coralliilyticus]
MNINQTTHLLTFFDGDPMPTNPIETMKGPLSFGSELEAVEVLFHHVKNRIADSYAELFAESADSNNIDILQYTSDDDVAITRDEVIIAVESEYSDSDSWANLIDWYSSVVEDCDGYFAYKIEVKPVHSFLEQMRMADAVEIDDNFVRHFNVTSVDDYDNLNDQAVMEAEMVDGDYKQNVYSVNYDEAMNAYYNAQLGAWQVGELSIKFFKVS